MIGVGRWFKLVDSWHNLASGPYFLLNTRFILYRN
jgi:hypothetical protein